MTHSIYMDHAAATPIDPSVLAAMQPYFAEKFYNPSALYLAAKDVAKDIADARAKIARRLGSRPAEIVFTSGGTEANNLAIRGVMEQFPGCNLIVSAVEHDSVLRPASNYDCKIAPVDAGGALLSEEFKKLIDDKTVLVSVMYANNEVGTMQPLSAVVQAVLAERHARLLGGDLRPLYIHTDACQAVNYCHLQVRRLGVDMMTINGGKIYGPKQSGVLFVNAHAKLSPQITGGGQEFGMRSGTENVANIIGLAEALDVTQDLRDGETRRLSKLQDMFIDLLKQKLADVRINGYEKHRLANNVHVTLPGRDNERMIMQLDEAGIMAAAGSACSASSDEPSHVLKAMGLTDKEAQSSLRFTMGRSTTEADVRRTVDTLATLAI